MNRFFVFIAVVFMIFLFSSCHIVRFFWWNFADINDGKKFQSVAILKGKETFYFKEITQNISLMIPADIKLASDANTFDQLLEKSHSVSFLIIRNDSILYEKYFKRYSSSSELPSFSVSKSFVSALIGIAIEEGYIKSIDQKVSEFIPEMRDPGFAEVSIANLLTMRSGIEFVESYGNPFAAMPKFYYGTNLKKMIYTLKIKEAPNLHYDYQSVNTIILTMILEKATGVAANVYLQEKIWKQIGMESDANWNVDSRKHLVIKSNCCINAHTRDFARFGRLYLNNGNWNGRQIIPESWIKQSKTIFNDSRDSQGYPYTYHWRTLNNGSLFAKGILGQYIFLYPEKKLIIVRMGSNSGNINWVKLFEELSVQL